jgi:hypothetical protein
MMAGVMIVSRNEELRKLKFRVWVCGVGVLQSVTIILTAPDPPVVVVPVITPVVGLSVRAPGGRPVWLKVSGPLPPLVLMFS